MIIPILFISTTTNATEFAPYVWSWGGGVVRSLKEAQSKTKMSSAVLAFAISRSGCSASTPGSESDIQAFQSNGGSVAISFGGANGTYLEQACKNSGDLTRVIEGLMERLHTRRLDFDIEGTHLKDQEATARRIEAIKLLQKKHPQLEVSFTLPVNPDGLTIEALEMLKRTVAAGVKVKIINIMTMDYYRTDSRSLGAMAIASAEGTIAQLKTIFPRKSKQQLYEMLGITPMIGRNDDGKIFTLEDAEEVGAYAKKHAIGRLSFWAMQRDQDGKSIFNSTGLGGIDSVGQNQFAFYNAFKKAIEGNPAFDGTAIKNQDNEKARQKVE